MHGENKTFRALFQLPLHLICILLMRENAPYNQQARL